MMLNPLMKSCASCDHFRLVPVAVVFLITIFGAEGAVD